MNLHKVQFPLRNVALWLHASGQNGRAIGTHLWPVEEGTPPPFDLAGRQTYNTSYWSPRRFTWSPFVIAHIFRGGYQPPLCGHRSQSRSPRINTSYSPGTCTGCVQAATRLGYTPLTYREALDQSTTRLAIAEETLAWTRAGRPTEWPLTSET